LLTQQRKQTLHPQDTGLSIMGLLPDECGAVESLVLMTIDATNVFWLELTDLICQGSASLYDESKLVGT
jgi:hypothetical protein